MVRIHGERVPDGLEISHDLILGPAQDVAPSQEDASALEGPAPAGGRPLARAPGTPRQTARSARPGGSTECQAVGVAEGRLEDDRVLTVGGEDGSGP